MFGAFGECGKKQLAIDNAQLTMWDKLFIKNNNCALCSRGRSPNATKLL